MTIFNDIEPMRLCLYIALTQETPRVRPLPPSSSVDRRHRTGMPNSRLNIRSYITIIDCNAYTHTHVHTHTHVILCITPQTVGAVQYDMCITISVALSQLATLHASVCGSRIDTMDGGPRNLTRRGLIRSHGPMTYH